MKKDGEWTQCSLGCWHIEHNKMSAMVTVRWSGYAEALVIYRKTRVWSEQRIFTTTSQPEEYVYDPNYPKHIWGCENAFVEAKQWCETELGYTPEPNTIDVTIRFPKGEEKAVSKFLEWMKTSNELASMTDEDFYFMYDIVVNEPKKLITFLEYVDKHEE